jgi:NADH-quinone oxidoreductase subunit N
MNYTELLTLLAPETLIVLAALGVLTVDLVTLRDEGLETRRQWLTWMTVGGCVVAGAALFISPGTPPDWTRSLEGMLTISPLSQLLKGVLLLLTACTALISLESKFTTHVGEYFALLLLATVGMMFLVSTENILLIFISLELLSLCLYVIVAFHKSNVQSAEAALKYFLFGGMSAAFLLFGLSLMYGLSGHLHLSGIASFFAGSKLDPLGLVAMLMVAVGFGFKVAAVPFHLWAPDAYQGAPVPSAAFIASGSKVASFFVLAKVMMAGFAGAEGSGAWRGFAQGWVPMLAVFAALSMLIGNLAAIAQSSVKRLLAYSAIAHSGYALVGVLAHEKADGFAAVIYYVTTYALTTVGAFAVVSVVQERSGDRLSDFAGLSRRSPLLAGCLLIFLLSLAGVPPLAGFFGKFYVFKAWLFVNGNLEASQGMLWLIILALAMSAVSLYYYLQVLKQAFVVPPDPEAKPLLPATSTCWAVAALALLVTLLGCVPGLLVGPLTAMMAGVRL